MVFYISHPLLFSTVQCAVGEAKHRAERVATLEDVRTSENSPTSRLSASRTTRNLETVRLADSLMSKYSMQSALGPITDRIIRAVQRNRRTPRSVLLPVLREKRETATPCS